MNVVIWITGAVCITILYYTLKFNSLLDQSKVTTHTYPVVRSISFNLSEATDLVEAFGEDSDTVITVERTSGHSGYGLYAHFEEYPEEGSVLLGKK